MGQRKHQRVKMVLPIRVTGRDADGSAFSLLAHTLDFSKAGARLGGIRAKLQIGDEVTVEYKRGRGRFQVRWVALKRNQVGVQNLDPEKFKFIDLPDEKYLDDADTAKLREGGDQSAGTHVAPAAPASHQPAAPARPAAKPGAGIAHAAVQPITTAGQLAELKRKLRAAKDDTDAALQIVADASRELLSASGAAVAVLGGDEWICRASSGVAPRIGVQFQAPQGLTGQAVAGGQVVICRDAEADPRLNASIWRSVELRSAASVPIMHKSNVLGVLEVFGEQANAFSDESVPLLRELGELVAGLITVSSTTS